MNGTTPTMSDSTHRRRTRSDAEIDISTSSSVQWMNPNVNWMHWTLWFVIVTVVMAIYFLVDSDWSVGWMLVATPGLLVVGMVGCVTWILAVRRGIFTWMRLARQPSLAMTRGDAAAAERTYQKALERAGRFPAQDHRRGLMLFELAGYAKNQGRYPEAKRLFAECVEILGQHQRLAPMDYFVSLNNYAVYFIHLRDRAAAQVILEKVLDLTLMTKRGSDDKIVVLPYQIQEIEMLLHLNLVFLFIEMCELAEAQHHLQEADSIVVGLKKRSRAKFHDQHIAMRAHWKYASGKFADAGSEVEKAHNPDYAACLRVRAKLHLIRQEFSEAEQVLGKYFDQEKKKGPLHRPELRDQTLDLAECLFGQGKHEPAFLALQEARAIVADFALPLDAGWRKTLEAWLQRARELGKADAIAALDAELQKIPAKATQAVTILEKFRIHPQTAG
jgi:tetratricopeptide (TPR) repeat protein